MSCVVPNCPGANSDNIKLFRIPEKCIKKWCYNIRIKEEKIVYSSRICNRHFHIDCIGKMKLKSGSMPTEDLGK